MKGQELTDALKASLAETGAELITAERNRQVSSEGWSKSHDDSHVMFELSRAAVSYARVASRQGELTQQQLEHAVPTTWPWHYEAWKPSTDPIRNLVKAGALIAAEIDRLQRKKGGRA